MPGWNVEHTRTRVHKLFGDRQLALAKPSLASLVDRQVYASYHYHEYKTILDRDIDSRLESASILEIALPFHSNNRWNIDNTLNQAAANAIGCLQNLHCLIDTLSFALFYCLGLNLVSNALKEHQVSMLKILALLKKEPKHSQIAAVLDLLALDKNIIHLSALVNHSKHRSIISTQMSVDLRGTIPYEIMFMQFQYDGKQHTEKEAEHFMQTCYSILSFKIVECGNALNATLDKMI